MGNPGQPRVPPFFTNNHRVGRQVVHREHCRGPVKIILGQTATDPMDIRGIAVVRRAHGDDGFQGGRPKGGNLQAVEPAPTDPVHRNLPVAPILCGQPGNRGDPIGLFLQGVFVVNQPFAIAGAANIQPHTGIAMPRQIGVHRMVAAPRPFAFAIGQIFKNCRGFPGVLRQPKGRGKAHTIRHRDKDILYQTNCKWKIFDHLRHEEPPHPCWTTI